MRQFRATQHTTQYGAMSLHLRFIGKHIFMKGVQNSSHYVDKVIKDMRSKGAVVQKGNGGWMRIDIIKDNELVKLGDIEFNPKEQGPEAIEDILYNFFSKKYAEAKFAVQEVV